MHRMMLITMFGVANLFGGISSYAVLDFSPTALIAGLTAVAMALLGSIRLITPAIVEAIKTIGPALAELRKQRDDINRGSLSAQLDEMKATAAAEAKEHKELLLSTQERVEAANQKLHDAKDQAQAEAFKHAEETQSIKADLESSRAEIARLREENMAMSRLVNQKAQTAVDQSAVNAGNIALLARESGVFPVVVPAPADLGADDEASEPSH